MNTANNFQAAALQWQSPHMLGAALVVAAAVVLAVTLLYPAQVRLLPPLWRWTLPGLRCIALLALTACLARPVAQRLLTEDEQGAYVVLIDNSRSMATVDTQRRPASLVALADGLGLLDETLRARAEEFKGIESDVQRLSELYDMITQAQVDLDYAQLQGRDNPDALKRYNDSTAEFSRRSTALTRQRDRLRPKSRRFADALEALRTLPKFTDDDWQRRASDAIENLSAPSAQFQAETDDDLYRRNDQVRQLAQELAHLSRFQLVERAIVDERGGLLSKLPAKAPLYGYTIGAKAQPQPLRGSGGRNVKRLLATPDAPTSDLSAGLREVLDRLRHLKIHAVVLFSDGRHIGEEASPGAGILSGNTSVPVYTILTAPQPADGAVRDLAIAAVEMPSPPNVFVGETMNVSVQVVWTSAAASIKPAEVTIETAARPFRASVEEVKDQPRRGTARFSLQFDEPGPQKLTISIKHDRSELTDVNNTTQRWVKVLSDRFEVLLVGGAPSWDFRHLKNILSRTRWVNLRTALLDTDDARLDLAAQQLAAYDVILLCDTPSRGLSTEQWDAVRKMVAQRGGSVILMAGPAHLPREYATGALSEFLPYKRSAAALGGTGAAALWRTWPGEDPEFRFVPAPDLTSADLDLVALADDHSDSWYRWNSLPRVFRYFALPDLKEATQPLLVERDTRAPVLTRQRLGRGKVFFLGLDETWRWRSQGGDRDQERFFRQLIRAAADEPYAVSNGLLSLDADQVVIRPGEWVRVRALVVDPGAETWAFGTPPPSSWIDLDILRDGALVTTQSLPAVADPNSGRFEGRVGNLDPGHYVLRLRAPYAAGVEYPLHVSENYEQELRNLSGDPDFLQRLARSSGGHFKTLETFDDVPKLLAESRKLSPRLTELRLWDSWYLYATVVSALTAEWALRKRFGLA